MGVSGCSESTVDQYLEKRYQARVLVVKPDFVPVQVVRSTCLIGRQFVISERTDIIGGRRKMERPYERLTKSSRYMGRAGASDSITHASR